MTENHFQTTYSMKFLKHRFEMSSSHPIKMQNMTATHTHTKSFNLEEGGNIFGLFNSYKKWLFYCYK